jgi:hypothetical protein
MLRTGGRVARPLSTVEIRQYGEAVDVDPWAYPAGPSKQCRRCGGPLEVVERARQGRDPWEPVLWEPVLHRCPNGCLPRHGERPAEEVMDLETVQQG